MPTLRSIWRALSQLNPLLLDGIVALTVFGLMASQFIATKHLLSGQHQTTAVAWVLAVLIAAPIMTHRRFPLISLAVCLAALIVFAARSYVAYPLLAVFVLTFDITLHSGRRVTLIALFMSLAVTALSLRLQSVQVAPLATWIESGLGVMVAWLAGENLRHRRAR